MALYKLLATSTTSIDYVNDAVVDDIGSLITKVFSWVTGNPILTVFLTMSMISIAFVIIGWLKGVVKLH